MGIWSDVLRPMLEALDFMPAELVVMILAFSPIGEVRLSVPVGVFFYEMGWAKVVLLSLVGNLATGPVAIWLYPRLEVAIRKSDRGAAFLDRVYERTRSKNSTRVERLKEAAVGLFIAIPIPGSGAWAGALVAHVFGMTWQRSWRYFYAGVVAATFLVTALVVTGHWAFAPA